MKAVQSRSAAPLPGTSPEPLPGACLPTLINPPAVGANLTESLGFLPFRGACRPSGVKKKRANPAEMLHNSPRPRGVEPGGGRAGEARPKTDSGIRGVRRARADRRAQANITPQRTHPAAPCELEKPGGLPSGTSGAEPRSKGRKAQRAERGASQQSGEKRRKRKPGTRFSDQR